MSLFDKKFEKELQKILGELCVPYPKLEEKEMAEVVKCLVRTIKVKIAIIEERRKQSEQLSFFSIPDSELTSKKK